VTENEYYVEPRKAGGFAVEKAGGKKASLLTKTQGAAITAAKNFDPVKKPHVARVRNTKVGTRGKLRKTP